jgi:periplasmic divalent cation tolerance protein
MFLDVHTSFSSRKIAEQVSRKLIEERLAACANILPASSLYRWKGSIARKDEVIVYFKTTETLYPKLEKRIVELHPYEVPMITASKIHLADGKYSKWLEDSLTKEE